MENNVRSIDCGGIIGEIKYKILNPGGNKTALIKGCEYTNNQKKLINKIIQPSGYSINIELEGNNNYIENAIISGFVI